MSRIKRSRSFEIAAGPLFFSRPISLLLNADIFHDATKILFLCSPEQGAHAPCSLTITNKGRGPLSPPDASSSARVYHYELVLNILSSVTIADKPDKPQNKMPWRHVMPYNASPCLYFPGPTSSLPARGDLHCPTPRKAAGSAAAMLLRPPPRNAAAEPVPLPDGDVEPRIRAAPAMPARCAQGPSRTDECRKQVSLSVEVATTRAPRRLRSSLHGRRAVQRRG